MILFRRQQQQRLYKGLFAAAVKALKRALERRVFTESSSRKTTSARRDAARRPQNSSGVALLAALACSRVVIGSP